MAASRSGGETVAVEELPGKNGACADQAALYARARGPAPQRHTRRVAARRLFERGAAAAEEHLGECGACADQAALHARAVDLRRRAAPRRAAAGGRRPRPAGDGPDAGTPTRRRDACAVPRLVAPRT
ncbi:hypothetical protein [Streptomyces sp. NPDC004528]|uniref:hypothetical protein n=1 Tax=Streptomyces sp. NPDC004528 TaxID=3154550 RepID=UPI0033B0532D